ncbi:NCS2 family permease [Mesosutterella sp. OilRF-GAM-744-9]|uniref:NCS2 family permease n=1 Tax=Mesosutterella porci TaxID=2915351 RepID=A0ABS9MR82_9BURK|nr:NCS2 family permease [Mesosutterella sp. oilRF-744-WT-GAM-9]MCG5030829.1 NCS2 family permease [Mesosutterella sp. oilRF-744-WT-GAM-9]MCI6530728.1 NCS2 family permease [Mesosutterella sp.]
MDTLNRFFGINAAGSTVKREILAGLTTFITMCYLLAVVPGMLTHTGLSFGDAFVSTVWITVIATLVMGLWANFPVAVAPGLGISAFFSFMVCGPMGYSWQTGFAAVLVSGVIFAILTFTKIRQLIINSVPAAMKAAIPAGIGLFIAFIGMKNCGLIVSDPSTFVALGKMTSPPVYLTLLCVILIGVLIAKNVTGAMILGMAAVTALGFLTGASPAPDLAKGFSEPLHFFPSTTFLQLDFSGLMQHSMITVLFTLCFVDLFDNLGTLIGVCSKAGYIQKDGTIHGIDRALMADSVGTICSGLLGCTTATTYLESVSGVSAGGRTGLTALTVAVLFALSLFLAPVLALVPVYATSAALIIVGAMMLGTLKSVRWDDFTDALPAFLTVITMPLTFNIATGLGIGFISFFLLKLLSGRRAEVNVTLGVLAALFVVSFALR